MRRLVALVIGVLAVVLLAGAPARAETLSDCLAKQESAEHRSAIAETAPVRRRESRVHVLDPSTGTVLHPAHLRLDALVDLALVVDTDRDHPARPAVRWGPGHVGHRHAVPRVEEAHRAPSGFRLAVRDGFGAGQTVLTLGDVPADGPHVVGSAGRVQAAVPRSYAASAAACSAAASGLLCTETSFP